MHALEDAELGKYWTPDALHAPHRAVVTDGRRDGEKLPLIVFLHGDWQDGTDNESQLAGDGIPFSSPGLARVDLEPISNKRSGAVTILRYRVAQS